MTDARETDGKGDGRSASALIPYVVSPVGIDHGKAKPKAEAVWLIPPGEP